MLECRSSDILKLEPGKGGIMANLTVLEIGLVAVFVVLEFVAVLMLPRWIKAVARKFPR